MLTRSGHIWVSQPVLRRTVGLQPSWRSPLGVWDRLGWPAVQDGDPGTSCWAVCGVGGLTRPRVGVGGGCTGSREFEEGAGLREPQGAGLRTGASWSPRAGGTGGPGYTAQPRVPGQEWEKEAQGTRHSQGSPARSGREGPEDNRTSKPRRGNDGRTWQLPQGKGQWQDAGLELEAQSNPVEKEDGGRPLGRGCSRAMAGPRWATGLWGRRQGFCRCTGGAVAPEQPRNRGSCGLRLETGPGAPRPRCGWAVPGPRVGPPAAPPVPS